MAAKEYNEANKQVRDIFKNNARKYLGVHPEHAFEDYVVAPYKFKSCRETCFISL
jgi:hypothetical protein